MLKSVLSNCMDMFWGVLNDWYRNSFWLSDSAEKKDTPFFGLDVISYQMKTDI